MVINDGGSVTEVSDVQLSKTLLSMLVNDGGSVTAVSDLQPAKAP